MNEIAAIASLQNILATLGWLDLPRYQAQFDHDYVWVPIGLRTSQTVKLKLFNAGGGYFIRLALADEAGLLVWHVQHQYKAR